MAGLCNRSQWYLPAAALLLVAFYLTHDDSTRLHSSEGFSPSRWTSENAYARVSYRCTRNVPRARACLVHVHVSRMYANHRGHGRSRRAVKASQSSFHCCSLHGRVGNTRGDSKGNQIRGKANERPGHARHTRNARTYIFAYVHTHLCACARARAQNELEKCIRVF